MFAYTYQCVMAFTLCQLPLVLLASYGITARSYFMCLPCQSESGWNELRGLTGLQKLLSGLTDV